MKCNPNRTIRYNDQCDNAALNLGMCSVWHTLKDKYDWENVQFARLDAAVSKFCEAEIRPKVVRFTAKYQDELDYNLTRLVDAVEQILDTPLRGPVAEKYRCSDSSACMGMYLVVYVLSDKFGWTETSELRTLLTQAIGFWNEKLKPSSERYSKRYLSELAKTLDRFKKV